MAQYFLTVYDSKGRTVKETEAIDTHRSHTRAIDASRNNQISILEYVIEARAVAVFIYANGVNIGKFQLHIDDDELNEAASLARLFVALTSDRQATHHYTAKLKTDCGMNTTASLSTSTAWHDVTCWRCLETKGDKDA